MTMFRQKLNRRSDHQLERNGTEHPWTNTKTAIQLAWSWKWIMYTQNNISRTIGI